jgi:glycosyltransferase involved in cell wall biosynthesis
MPSKLYYWVDHTTSYEGNSGVQRVVRCLARELRAVGEEVVFVKWNDGFQALARCGDAELERLARFDGPAAVFQEHADTPLHLNGVDLKSTDDGGDQTNGWLIVPEVTHFSRDGGEVTPALIAYAHYYRLKIAFVFYDLIPIRLKGYEDIRDAHRQYVEQIALGDLIIPISVHSGEDLRSYYVNDLRLPAHEIPQIHPVPLGEDFVNRPRAEAVEDPEGGPLSIMCVGTVEPRKNQVMLLEAFNAICRRHPDLDLTLNLIGHTHPKVSTAVDKLVSANPRIKQLSYLPDEQVVDLYRQCRLAAFPSVEEGYGLPIIEALWFGKPVLCAGFGSMGEIAENGGCLTVDTRSPKELERGLEKLILDRDHRMELARDALDRPLRTWNDYAGDVMGALARHTPLRRVYLWTDLTLQQPFNTGVQRVVRGLASAFIELGIDLQLVKWDDDRHDFAALSQADLDHLAKWNGPDGLRARPLARDFAGHWLILPEVTVPLRPADGSLMDHAHQLGLKVGSIFFDLIPHKMRENYPPGAMRHFYDYWEMLSQSDLILSISKAAGVDLDQFYRARLGKLNNIHRRIVPCTLPGEFSEMRKRDPAAAARPSARSGMPPVMRVVAIGTREPRKNYVRLLEALKLIADERKGDGDAEIQLTIVGRGGIFPDLEARIQDLNAQLPNVTILDHVGDAELDALLTQADFTIFSSYEEGFGLPIIESLWNGLPCLCHNDGAIAETAEGGGCLMVDMLDVAAIADGIRSLAFDGGTLERLKREIAGRRIKTWEDYALEFIGDLAAVQPRVTRSIEALPANLPEPVESLAPPLLSICVTTYNRAEWLRHSLRRILDMTRAYRDVVEIVVCDNTSTDHTPDVVREFEGEENFRAYRNPVNVGMLGNLGVTARHARGRFVWVFGDDDLMIDGIIEDVLHGIINHPDIHMVYLNYAYTHFDKPADLRDVDELIRSATTIAEGGPNRYAKELREVAALNENLFTAIYACVFRRDHAIMGYGQNIKGQPFGSLLTCVPSSVYALNALMDKPCYWIGRPGVVVNMNVSWKEFVLLWHLERMPDLFDLAERQGVTSPNLDVYRLGHCANAANHARQIYFSASDEVRANFSMERLLERCKHLDEFRERQVPMLAELYREAWKAGRIDQSSESPPEVLFESFGLIAQVRETVDS